MPQFELGEWLPDQPTVALPGLAVCKNAIPNVRGYRSFPGEVVEPGKAPIPSECRGAFSGTTENGTDFIVAGTDSNSASPVLSVIFGSVLDWIDASPSAALSTFVSDGKWDFAQYGDKIIAVAKGIDPQVIDLSTTPSAGSFSNLGSGASQASCCAVFKNFAILGNLVGVDGNPGGNAVAVGTRSNAIHWSAIGDVESWPVLGQDAATNVQSDWQLLDGNGGEVTAIVPGGEYCAVFQERALWRLDYVGLPNVFSLRLVEGSLGCSVERTAVAVNNVIYFLSNQGFMAFDGASVKSIGSDRVDDTVIQLLDRVNTANVFATHNAESHCVFWTIQTSEAYPDSIYAYQYEINRWFEIESGSDYQCIFSALEPNVAGSLDSLPYSALKLDSTTGGEDTTLQNSNLDALGVSNGKTVLGFFDSSNSLRTFSDFENSLDMSFETGEFEIPDSARAVVSHIRPLFEGSLTNVTVSGRNSVLEEKTTRQLMDKNSVGVYSPSPGGRVGGRYLSTGFTTTGESKVYGFDVSYRQGGRR